MYKQDAFLSWLLVTALLPFGGTPAPNPKCRVAIIITKCLKQAVVNVLSFLNRIIMKQLISQGVELNIHINAPTANKSSYEIEDFYIQLDSVLKLMKNSNMTCRFQSKSWCWRNVWTASSGFKR